MTTKYLAARNLAEALAGLDEGAKVLAGGTDLMVHVRRLRLCGAGMPEYLVDVTGVPELNRLDMDAHRPFLGAAVTFRGLETDETVAKRYPLLAQAAASVGSLQIRNLATIGGNAANASPAADGLTALAALGARAEIASSDGVRHIPLEQLIIGPNTTCLRPGDLIVGFELDRLPEGSAQRFCKVGRRRAVVIARMNLAVSIDGDMADPRLVLGSCFPSPRRLTEVERLLASGTPGPELWREAGKMAAGQFVEVCGRRESASYKVPAVAHLVSRTLESTWDELGVAR
ncbi:MAG: FAD binding domain-containing protein [Pseudomonadota bacterium]